MQEYWSGLPFSSPGDLSDSRIELRSALQAYSLPSEPPGKQASLMYLNVMRSLTLPPPQLVNIFCGPSILANDQSLLPVAYVQNVFTSYFYLTLYI